MWRTASSSLATFRLEFRRRAEALMREEEE
jgi:hypothetical protein